MGTRGSASHGGAGYFGRNFNLSGYYDPAHVNVYDAEQMHLHHGNFSQELWNSLSDAERAGIRSYTGAWYTDMNDALFGGGAVSGRVQQMIDNATSGMNRMASQFNFVAYRGDSPYDMANLLGGTRDQLRNAAFLRGSIGKTVEFKGFMSTAIHEDYAWTHKGVTTVIKTPKGAKGFFVDPVSANQGEKEFLFQRGTKMKVVRIETDSSGDLKKIYLEVVPGKK